MSSRVEFYGGPLDGEVRAIYGGPTLEFRVALLQHNPFLTPAYDPKAEVSIREGIYRFDQNHETYPYRYDWMGEK